MFLAIGDAIWMLKGIICEWAEKKMNVKDSKRDKGLKKRRKKHSSSSDCDSSANRKPDAKKKNKKKSSSSYSVINGCQVSSDNESKPRTSKSTKKRTREKDLITSVDNQLDYVEKSRSGFPGILKKSTSTIVNQKSSSAALTLSTPAAKSSDGKIIPTMQDDQLQVLNVLKNLMFDTS